MLGRVRGHLTYANVVSTLCLFVVLGGGAYAAGSLVGRDGTVTACVKRSGAAKGALRIVPKGTRCRRGEQRITFNRRGPAGAPGPAGSVQGAAAGGDLTGSYPNPEIAPNTVGSAEAADDSLTGADILESSLGKVPDADAIDGVDSSDIVRGGGRVHRVQASVAANSGVAALLNIPGVGILEIGGCSATADKLTVHYRNGSGTQQTIVRGAHSESAASPSTIAATRAPGANFFFELAAAAVPGGHAATLSVQPSAGTGPGAMFQLAAATKAGASNDRCMLQAVGWTTG